MAVPQNNDMNDLYLALAALQKPEEIALFLEDICTISELVAIAQRLAVARSLQGGMVYNHISEQTGASSATISRVSRCLQYGSGGYALAFKALDDGAAASHGAEAVNKPKPAAKSKRGEALC